MKITIEKTENGYTVTAHERSFYFESIFAATLKVSEFLHDYERNAQA